MTDLKKLFKAKKFVLLLSFVAFQVIGYAQSTIKGKVTDSKGDPLIGATIVVKNSAEGAASNAQGEFSFQTSKTLKHGSILTFSYIGYKSQEVKFNDTYLNVSLSDNSTELDNVVVTALGIKREEKGLGYSTRSVGGDEIANTNQSNWSSALNGKVAGLSVMSPGGPLSSTRVSLRGDVSLNVGGNNALIIVDGVPMSSPQSNPGVAYGAGSAAELSVDYGNGFSDINPNDIENIQVLKGASATALYGTRAANGVIMVTTKSGSNANKGLGVTFTSNISTEDAAHFPDYQYEFGQGLPSNIGKVGTEYAGKLYYSYGAAPDGNSSTSGTSSAYGAAFNPDQLYYQFDPITQTRSTTATPWIPYKDNRSGLFQTGYTLTNSVAITGKGDKGSMRVSLTHTKNEWILPNTGFQRFVASVSAQQQVSRRLKVALKTSQTYRTTDNVPALGYNSNSISYFLIFQNPNVDLSWLRPMWRTGLEKSKQLQPYSSFIGNPYVTLYENENPSKKYSSASSLTANLELSNRFEFQVRSAIQLTNDIQEQHRTVSDVVYGNGYFKKQNVFDYELNTDALLTFHDSYSNGLTVNTSVGGNVMYRYYDALSSAVIGLITPGIYMLANGASNAVVSTNIRKKAINSLYFTANFAYQNKLFLDVTGRNDWSSTLPAQNRSFFYPSVTTSILVNELVELPSAISLLKLRASWAQVGNDTDPYKTSSYYNTGNFPGSVTVASTLFNQNFKPEISTNYETGIDFRMFKNRLAIDLAYYSNKTKNQILDAPLDPTTGYSRATINSGTVRNQGIEVELTAIPVKTKDFVWKANLNWSKNYNKILSLAEGSDENQLISNIGSASLIGTVGGTTADLWGYKLVRNPNGDVVIGADGLPLRGSEIEYVGSAYPSWKAGMSNEFTYKGFRFSFQIDGQLGGLIYSQSFHKMTEQGKLAYTLNGRTPGSQYYIAGDDPRITGNPALTQSGGIYMVAPGVVKNTDGSYSPNSKLITVESYYKEYNRIANVETNSFDGSYLKLREVRFDYSLPAKIIKKTPLTAASIGVYGRNLLCITDYPLFDPETVALNGSSIVPGIETGSLPSTRTLGVNLSVSF
ncbi:TonB-dependent receptor plug [Paludibacter propionicigenes WB4]|uniref:TonB-dependent receptor plug n=1 Tax=Paludibacter propionicigenes (strain DSM 17365 / JCM 13257 / WB4) TaxID=694427 RepID=E4T4F6_PALPW|nr:SusC/RagA family TonB-linked outer membrane protein [Paludibacter propionicigenes]ADQ79600.1 TonB-dependent receptor plug [Paludibacter propionicigenes WB4]